MSDRCDICDQFEDDCVCQEVIDKTRADFEEDDSGWDLDDFNQRKRYLSQLERKRSIEQLKDCN